MNTKLEQFKQNIKSKNVAVLGMGISNRPLIKYLSKLGVKITAFDKQDMEKHEAALKEFEGLDIGYSLGENYLSKLKGFDLIFKTPGMRFDIPELLEESKNGALVTSEMEVFFDLCPAEIIAVTGSDGKTTTTTLVYNILKEAGYKCWLGGNIGTPLLDKIDEIDISDKVVLELSSFQLHTMKKSPKIAVITNMSPNHLDIHKSMDEYIGAKKNIFLYQNENDKLVVNFDNEITRSFAKEVTGKVRFFSRLKELDEGAILHDNYLVYRSAGKDTKIVKADEIAIPGVHNVENYLAAISAVIDLVEPESIAKVARTFKGVEHRIEFIKKVDGVSFYNDSIGTSPTRTIASLNAFKGKVVLIAGGYDKKIPYDDMGQIIVNKVDKLILLGKTGPKIEMAYLDYKAKNNIEIDIPVVYCDSMEEAVEASRKDAKDGDTVILSPASASFDLYRNFEERGNRFKEAVNNLR